VTEDGRDDNSNRHCISGNAFNGVYAQMNDDWQSDLFEGNGSWKMHRHPWQRQTSFDAWQTVQACGWATKKMKQAYSLLYFNGPLTLLELERASAIEDHRHPRGRSESTVIRRLYDLRDNGLTQITTLVRKCGVSGKNAVTWDVTESKAPKERKTKPPVVCPKCGHIWELRQ
jgi:hypothetical protein